MSDEIEKNELRPLPTVYEASSLVAMSETLLKSGMLPVTLKRPEQVAAIILRGRELGIGPMEALTSINVIKGKVQSSTQLMLALIYRSGLLEDIEMVRGDPAKVTMKRMNTTSHTATFGSKDMKRASLQGKDNYRKWPEIMFMWRAIAICARVVFPDVVGAIYSPDELGVSLRSDAETVIEAKWSIEPEPEQPDHIADAKRLKAEGKMNLLDIAKETGLSVAKVAKL